MKQIKHPTGVEADERNSAIVIANWGWHKFNQLFPDEESCIRELYKHFNGESISCHICAGTNTRRLDERSFYCVKCHRKYWFTAGTLFRSCKKVRPWFAANWLQEQGIKLNGSQLANFTSIAKSTGTHIINSITRRNKSRLRPKNTLRQRSTKSKTDRTIKGTSNANTKVRLEPVSEQSDKTTKDFKPKKLSSHTNSDDSLSEKKKRLLQTLGDEPRHFETLLNTLNYEMPDLATLLTLLELDEMVTKLPGDYYVRAQNKSHRSTSLSEKQRDFKNRKRSNHPTIFSVFKSITGTIGQITELVSYRMSRITDDCLICGSSNRIPKRKFDETPERFIKPLLR